MIQIQTPPLFAHQDEDIDAAVARGSLGLFPYDCGTGKTATMLNVIQRLGGPALVVCPISIIETAWLADAATFTPSLRVVSLRATTPKQRLARLRAARHADVMIVNYAGFRILWSSHRQWLLDCKVNVLVVDESSKLKSPRSQITKALLAFGLGDGRGAPGVPHRFPMSGTPAPNALHEYWAQCRLVSPTVFDSNHFRFMRQWFLPVVSDPSNPRIVWRWGMRKGDREEFLSKVASVSVARRKEDCTDLPEEIDVTRHATMEPSQRAAYKAMLDTFVAEFDTGAPLRSGVAMAPNTLARLMKLRQITAGCIAPLDGVMQWRWNAKLNVLGELLDELGRERAVIWTQFRVEAAAVMAMLAERAQRAERYTGDTWWTARLDGTVKQADRVTGILSFQSESLDGEARYMVAHPASAGHGLTLTGACNAIYLSLSYSLEGYWQSRARLHRIGQTRPVTNHHVLVPDTIDEVIYKALRGKADMAEAALRFVIERRGQ